MATMGIPSLSDGLAAATRRVYNAGPVGRSSGGAAANIPGPAAPTGNVGIKGTGTVIKQGLAALSTHGIGGRLDILG